MFKKKILLLLSAVMILMSVSSLANFLDVRRDVRSQHTLINQTYLNSHRNASYMPNPKFGQSLFWPSQRGDNQIPNDWKGSRFWNYSSAWQFNASMNRTLEFWAYYNGSLSGTVTRYRVIIGVFNSSPLFGDDTLNGQYWFDIEKASPSNNSACLRFRTFAFASVTQVSGDNRTCSNVDKGWFHVAMSYYNTSALGGNPPNGKFIKLFFNGSSFGILRYIPGSARLPSLRANLTIGGNMPTKWDDNNGQHQFVNGSIDEVRISNSTRYFNNFTPPAGPFNWDSNTIALYHFNDPLQDSQAPRYYNITNNLSSIQNSPNTPYRFSVKWNDTNGGTLNNVTMVIFDTNITGTRRNYTLTFNPKDGSHFFNITNRTTINTRFYWKFYANDTNNNKNRTSIRNGTIDNTLPVIRIVNIPTATLNPIADATITDNLALSLCWYNITEQAAPNACIGTCPTYFTCSTDPTLTGLNNLQSYRLWISANDTSNNRNITRAGIATFNWTINLGLSSGGAGGGGGGIRTSNLITELELSCGTRIFSFLYYTKPNKFSRDTICKNEGKSNLNAELEITEKLSKYVKAEFCDIDGLKCSNSINLFSGESGLLRIKAEISEEFKFEDGFINIRSGSKVNQFGVEIAPNIGYSIISLISSFTGISDTIAIWILFVFVLIVMVLLFYYGGI